MKYKPITILLSLVLPFALGLCHMETHSVTARPADASKIVYTVDYKYIEQCAMGGTCEAIKLRRNSINDTVHMIFPYGGTESGVYFYVKDAAFIKWTSRSDQAQPKPLRSDLKKGGREFHRLDLTGLADGEYVACMFSCNLGGSFQVLISTMPKTGSE